jgi:hypothetical protein
VITVVELLAAGPHCLECLVRRTTQRFEEVERQLDALRAALREGVCTACAELGPVFSTRIAP